MLPKVQNATGELYLEVGMTQEGFQCFQRAWSNLMDISPSDVKDGQDLVKQKGMVDTCRENNPMGFRGRSTLGYSHPPRKGSGCMCFCALEYFGGQVRVDH